jgi:hypothetical protein
MDVPEQQVELDPADPHESMMAGAEKITLPANMNVCSDW